MIEELDSVLLFEALQSSVVERGVGGKDGRKVNGFVSRGCEQEGRLQTFGI